MVAEIPASQLASPGERLVDISQIKEVDQRIAQMPAVDPEVKVCFTPGMMSRQIFMEAGQQHRSKVHKTEHQFILSHGACLVSENGGPTFLMQAPYHGVTKPGTWRNLFIVIDCIWTTFHPTDKRTVEEVEKEIIQPLEEPAS